MISIFKGNAKTYKTKCCGKRLFLSKITPNRIGVYTEKCPWCGEVIQFAKEGSF